MGLLDAVKRRVAQPGVLDDEGLKGRVGEDVDVALEVPVVAVLGLVVEGAGRKAG